MHRLAHFIDYILRHALHSFALSFNILNFGFGGLRAIRRFSQIGFTLARENRQVRQDFLRRGSAEFVLPLGHFAFP